jgi:cytochrome bd-type quinol oxidase subunit 2
VKESLLAKGRGAIPLFALLFALLIVALASMLAANVIRDYLADVLTTRTRATVAGLVLAFLPIPMAIVAWSRRHHRQQLWVGIAGVSFWMLTFFGVGGWRKGGRDRSSEINRLLNGFPNVWVFTTIGIIVAATLTSVILGKVRARLTSTTNPRGG